MQSVIDLFCGAGGFSNGFKKEGFNILLGIDNNKNKIKTYKKNIKPYRTINADITKISGYDIKNMVGNKQIDIIIGSPPCKEYSRSNKNTSTIPFMQSGSTSLPYHFFRLVIVLRPKWFIMENVIRFYNTLDGEFIQQLFLPFGYTTQLHILNAADFGVPQKRKRGFLIGNLLNKKLTFKPTTCKYLTIKDAIDDLCKVDAAHNTMNKVSLLKPSSSYQKKLRKSDNYVQNHCATNHKKSTISILSKITQGQSREDVPDLKNTKSKYSGAYYRPYYNKPARTITTRFDTPSGDGDSIHPLLNRCFTPREAARLQSFDDSYVFYGNRQEIRLQIGDAVPPLLSQEIAKQIKITLS